MTKPSPISSLIAAGEALRKASEDSLSHLHAMGGEADLRGFRVVRAIAAWNKAAKANRGAGARKGK